MYRQEGYLVVTKGKTTMLVKLNKGSYFLNTDTIVALGHYSDTRHGEKAYFADVISGNRWDMTKKTMTGLLPP